MQYRINNSDGTVHIKVVGFPSGDSGFAGESMWVIIGVGSENDGVGILDNDSVCTNLCAGDLVMYGGGTDELKPSYKGRVGQ